MKPAAWPSPPPARSRSQRRRTSSGSARLDDLDRLPVQRRRARAGPRVVEQDEGGRRSRARLPSEAPISRQAARRRGGFQENAVVSSVFDLFKIGVGPSSSHTMGPMTAACRLCRDAGAKRAARADRAVEADLYGSLALTGKGHATDRAVLLGLSGKRPDSLMPGRGRRDRRPDPLTGRLRSAAARDPFDEPRDMRFLQRERLPHHSNGMRFTAFDADGEPARKQGLLFGRRRRVVDEAAIARNAPPEGAWDIPYNYHSRRRAARHAEREG
jgi:hypothetical protein